MIRTVVAFLLCVTTIVADDQSIAQPFVRKEVPEKAILGHWRTLAQDAEFFVQPDGRFVAKTNDGIADRSWKIVDVDADSESVKILVDPGESQVEYTIRLATGQQSCIAQEIRSCVTTPQHRSTTWVYVDDRTASESKQLPASTKNVEKATRNVDPSHPLDTLLVGHWNTLFGAGTEHYFAKNGAGCMTGCGIDVYQGWKIVDRTQQEKELGTLRIRRFSPEQPHQFYGKYTLHFASDGKSLLMESFDSEKRADSPYRYSRTWYYADGRTDPKQESVKPETESRRQQ